MRPVRWDFSPLILCNLWATQETSIFFKITFNYKPPRVVGNPVAYILCKQRNGNCDKNAGWDEKSTSSSL